MRYRVIILAIALIIPFSVSAAAPLEPAPEAGHPAPLFELKDSAGTMVKLSDLRGKVVLLNFWSVRCAPCVAEMLSLNNLATALNRGGLTVLAVSVDRSEQLVRSFVKETHLDVPVLLDRDEEVAFDAYAVTDLPVSFLIDKGGTIVEIFRGPKVWDSADIKKKVQRLLE